MGRQGYLEFIKDCVGQVKRQELGGVVLKRSQGELLTTKIEPEFFDERILGVGGRLTTEETGGAKTQGS